MGEDNKELRNYTRIFNPILEALYRQNLTGMEIRIILFVIRNTYGWKTKKHQMSTSYISSGTGICERTIKRIVKRLIKDGYLIYYGIDKETKCKVIGLNKKYSQWGVGGDTGDTDTDDTQGGDISGQKEGDNSSHYGVTSVTPKKDSKNKDSNKKDNNKKDMSPKNTFFLSSTGQPYLSTDDEYGYWVGDDGMLQREPLSKQKGGKKK